MYGTNQDGDPRALCGGLLDDREWRALARTLRLSPRERQIVERLFDDASEAVIADDLGISPHTVHTHLERLYHKLGVGSRCAVVARVFREYVVACRSGTLPPHRGAGR
jgi:DNA-binding CsgD family transcriptional regulator